ncbi:MAG: enoyl-CoA hydratase/isomerase family protein [Halobacteriales archaeon]|nr:enoyl-CoA hydratase/isomerase family protein [Halobacteriales archaeon]
MANVRVERRGKAAILTIDRPQALNALDRPTMEELRAHAEALNQDRDLVCVLLTGAGEKAFVAGADIRAMLDLAPLDAQAHSEAGHALLRALLHSPHVTIAAINGYALGGGLELAMACDLRIASETAQLGLPEVGLGVIPGFGGTQRLARLIGEARAKELMLTGERIPAQRALELGLLSKVVPKDQLMKEALALAERIAQNGPVAVRLAKHSLQRGLDMPLDAALAFEAACFGACFATHDQKEGMRAFMEKRPPKFEGR